MSSPKGDCIREAMARFRSKVELAKRSQMVCKERWLFICIEKRLSKSKFRKLRDQYLAEFKVEMLECDKL